MSKEVGARNLENVQSLKKIFKIDLDLRDLRDFFQRVGVFSKNMEDRIISIFLVEFIILLRNLTGNFSRPIGFFPRDVSDHFEKTKSAMTSITLFGSKLNLNNENVFLRPLFFVRRDEIHTLSFLIEELFLCSIANMSMCENIKNLIERYQIKDKDILYIDIKYDTVNVEVNSDDFISAEKDL